MLMVVVFAVIWTLMRRALRAFWRGGGRAPRRIPLGRTDWRERVVRVSPCRARARQVETRNGRSRDQRITCLLVFTFRLDCHVSATCTSITAQSNVKDHLRRASRDAPARGRRPEGDQQGLLRH